MWTEEHHAADDNRLPSRSAFADAVSGATDRIAVTLTAVIGPLHAPLRPAKEIAVPDLLGGGRLVTVAGAGYRPEEHALSGVDPHQVAGSRANCVQTLLTAWAGEEFTHRRGRVRLTPRPYTDPYPLPLVGRLLQGRRPPGRPGSPSPPAGRPPADAAAGSPGPVPGVAPGVRPAGPSGAGGLSRAVRPYDTAAPGPGSGRAGGGGRFEERAAGTWPFSPSSGGLATRLSPSPPGTCPSSP